jgi:hypothetical protein
VTLALIERLLKTGVIDPSDLTAMAAQLEREGDEQGAHEVLCCITALGDDRPILSIISGGKEIDD